MAYMIRCVNVMAGCLEAENIQRRAALPAALQRAQQMVRERLRAGYYHADYIDQWTILKRGGDIWRIRIESPTHHTPTPEADHGRPMLWREN